MNKLQVKIPAKVNLGLDVVRKREDNYHDIESIMHSINIYDCLTFEKSNQIIISSNNPDVPTDESNIVHKCIMEIAKTHDVNCLLSVHLDKNIPICAGLGGGSANGAAALIAYNEIYELGYTQERLCEIAAKVGADIPFLIHSGAAFCEGIGEIITPLFPYISCYIVLCKPDFGVSTGFAYDLIDKGAEIERPDFTKLLNGLLTMNKDDLDKGLINVFEPFVLKKYPEIKEIKNTFASLNARGVQMSGSGPSVFALFDKLSDAQKAYKTLKTKYDSVFLTNFIEEQDAIILTELR